MPIEKHNYRFAVTERFVLLGDWNKAREKYWRDVAYRVNHPENYPNGLLCPECHGRLYDTGKVTCISPNKLAVRCQECSFKGDRLE